MKVNVNIMNTQCIIMSEAVTAPSLMMTTLIVSEESLARETHTQTLVDFEKKKEKEKPGTDSESSPMRA